MVRTLAAQGDSASAPALSALAQDPSRPEAVRTAALDALAMLGGPQALRARLMLVYDPKTPAPLIARALILLGRDGALPPNDVAGFLENPSPTIRTAALLALSPKRPTPEEVRRAVIDRLNDPIPEVRKAAIEAAAQLKIREAIPRLVAVTNEDAYRTEATLALAALPDAQALPVYLAALQDRNPELRRKAEEALLAVRDRVVGDLEREARSGRLGGPALLAVERVLTRFTPIIDWRVIGPFPRTTAQVFIGESSIDFTRTHAGVEGRTLAWTARKADPDTGRVVLEDLKGGAGDRGGFGYDTNGSPDLNAFGSAEIVSDQDRSALMLVGSSGTIWITVNETMVYQYNNFAGRPYAPDSDLVRVELKKGVNRVLVSSRQGIGTWSFSVQVSEPSTGRFVAKPGAASPEALQAFALAHQGDPRKGEEIFFDVNGVGCVKCHAAGGRGTANIGPDLTGLALKYDKAEIIRSVLEPSNRIVTGYQPVLLALTDGKVLNGLVRAETDAYVELVDADTRTVRVPKAEIEERQGGRHLADAQGAGGHALTTGVHRPDQLSPEPQDRAEPLEPGPVRPGRQSRPVPGLGRCESRPAMYSWVPGNARHDPIPSRRYPSGRIPGIQGVVGPPEEGCPQRSSKTNGARSIRSSQPSRWSSGDAGNSATRPRQR